MLAEVCTELKNWFDKCRYIDKFAIVNGDISPKEINTTLDLQTNQYFRIVGSVFNDGIHQYPASDLIDEEFDGAVWALAIPKEVIDLADDISDWQDRYGGADSEAMSPFASESFGGYSYSKSGGGASDGSSNAGTWQGVFAARLNRWRKI